MYIYISTISYYGILSYPLSYIILYYLILSYIVESREEMPE